MGTIEWIGHASFIIKTNGQTIYVDPFKLTTVREHADAILITHPHFDHMNPDDIKKVADATTEIFVPKDSVSKIPVGKVTGVEPGKKYTSKGISFSTVPAYNNVKERLDKHPKKNGWVGYLIDIDGRVVYHAGDTDFVDEIKGLNVDTALLPMGGTYTMDVHQAADAANSMELKQASPMHYKALLGKEGSTAAEKEFVKLAKHAVLLKQVQEESFSFE
jgi:L-ascorbate metabolism protein UlaG (beta-lactamase superfamily)